MTGVSASRLSRTFGGAFGDKDYAFEELVAEFGSVILSNHFGLYADKKHDGAELEHLKSHVAYIKGWSRLPRDDPSALFRAWRLATQAADWVQALGRHFGQAALARAGVLSTRGSAHPYIEKMLVMPYASTGEIVGLRFRRLSQDTTYNGARYVTLRHGSNVVSTPYLADQTGWPVAMAPSGGIIWVVEGEPDTLSLRSLGRAAIGAPGARVWRSGWTSSWNKARKVIVVADADRPGVQASQSMFDAIYEDAVAQHGEAWARDVEATSKRPRRARRSRSRSRSASRPACSQRDLNALEGIKTLAVEARIKTANATSAVR